MMAKASKERKKRAQRRKVKQHKASSRLSLTNTEPDYSGPKQELVSHRARRIAEIIIAYPNQIAIGLAEREEAGWIFGRLYLVGVIDRDQKIAAERLVWAVSTYRRVLTRYCGVRAADLDLMSMQKGTPSEDLSPQIEKKFEKVREEYDINMQLLKECGEDIPKAILDAWESDSLTNLYLIRKGLDCLSNRRRMGPREATPEKREVA